jgi:ATP-dependent exoDNAse (exonuclease V) alpha subunit
MNKTLKNRVPVTTRKGGVVHTEILLSAHAPKEYADRAVLWNAVEKIEKQRNSQLAREIEIALPVELPIEQNIALARRFANEQFVAAGMCADVCVHNKKDGNPHAHIMLTMRPINPDGTWGAKVVKVNGKKTYPVDWDDRSKAEEWRRSWAAYANGALRLADKLTEENALDHRSYERQGVEQIPTVHLGPYASGLEKHGIATELGDKNRKIGEMNSKLRQINARLKKLETWKVDLLTSPPTLYETFSAMSKHEKPLTNWQGVNSVQSMSQTLLFFDKYGIETVADLSRAVSEMRNEFENVRADLKKSERRLATLGEHMRHSENYNKYRKIAAHRDKLYAKAKELDGKGLFHKPAAKTAVNAADAYAWKHLNELSDFDAAEKYLRGVLQKRFDPKKSPPVKAWADERTSLTVECATLNRRYETLKIKTQSVEKLKRSVEEIMNPTVSERERPKTHTHGYARDR